LVELFQSRGVKTTHVASEGMGMEERLARIKAYEAGEYACIVHVGILGEGYDNPNISVAAIFRPYRSLAPYAQFVGRAIRWIRAGGEADNLAHVVSHVGLNLGFLWEYFKAEARDAAFMAQVETLFFNDQDVPFDEETLELELEQEEPGTQVTREELAGYDVDTFLPVSNARDDLAFLGPILDGRDVAVATARGRAFQLYGQQMLSSSRRQQHERNGLLTNSKRPRGANTLREKSLELPFGRPDVERAQQRAWLSKEVQRAAGYALWSLRLPQGSDLGTLLGDILPHDEREGEAYALMMRALNRTLNAQMNKDASGSNRNDWTADELHEARQQLSLARERVVAIVREAMQDREQLRLEF
jgi:DNA repair protein RadD